MVHSIERLEFSVEGVSAFLHEPRCDLFFHRVKALLSLMMDKRISCYLQVIAASAEPPAQFEIVVAKEKLFIQRTE